MQLAIGRFGRLLMLLANITVEWISKGNANLFKILQKIGAHISNLVQALADHQQQQQQHLLPQNGSKFNCTADILLTFMSSTANEYSNGRRQSASSSNSMGSGGTPLTSMAEAEDDEEEEDEDEELQMD